MSTPVILYRSASQTNFLAAGLPQIKYPLPEDCPIQQDAYAFDQDFQVRIDQYPNAIKNTPASNALFGLNFSNHILTRISQPQNMGGMLAKMAATFSLVPASWDDFKTITYTFPGFPGQIGQSGTRDIFTDEVDSRIHTDYFVLDPTGILNGGTVPTAPTAGTVDDSSGTAVQVVGSLAQIPVIPKSYFFITFGGVTYPSDRTNSIVPVGGKIVGSTNWYQTVPQLANYQTWISNASSNAWTSTAWDGVTDAGSTTGQLVARESQLKTYAGNIIARETVYVLVK